MDRRRSARTTRNCPASSCVERLEHGLTHILDVREEWSDEEHVARSQPQVTYFWQGIPDLGQEVGTQWFDAGVEFALEALADPDNVVLAHCHAGINRGPSIGFAILLALGHDPVEALEMIRQARPIVMVAYAEDALRWRMPGWRWTMTSTPTWPGSRSGGGSRKPSWPRCSPPPLR